MRKFLQAMRIAVMRDPRRLPRLPGELRRYLGSLRAYRELAGSGGRDGRIEIEPTLFQRVGNMPFDAHYVYQAAWATQRVLALRPSRHVDVSSSIPFVAQLAAAIPVCYVELNPPRLELPRLRMMRGSLTALPFADATLRSVSCLHVVEHIGLGRYGDPLDPIGTEKAVRELARVVAPGGSLFLSTPVGRRRTCFNAHRVLDPSDVLGWTGGLALVEFSVVTDAGRLIEATDSVAHAALEYGCGLYWLRRRV